MSPPAAIVFDVDNTLTPPRRPLERSMADALRSLRVPFYVAAGSDLPLIRTQLLEPLGRYGFRGTFDAFLCNGAVRYRCEFEGEPAVTCVREFSLERHLGKDRYAELQGVVVGVLDEDEFRFEEPLRVIGDRIIDRGSMINIAPIGRPSGNLSEEAYANRDAFVRHDHAVGFRRRMLAMLNERLASMRDEFDLVITLGGETSFDLVVRGNDKRFALDSLLKEGYPSLLYVGDALFPEGNDGSILEFIAEWPGPGECPVTARRVANWQETLDCLREEGLVSKP